MVQNLNDSLANGSESKLSKEQSTSPVVMIILFMHKKCELLIEIILK